MTAGYDIIGDVHGHAAELEALLRKLGYLRRGGVWRHPERTAVFVGDLVDRGPENLRACRIAMAMTAEGAALAVMGNHEFNTICLATADPARPGSFLRPHTPKNLRQAAATRAEFERAPRDARAALAWMRRLPLWLELDGLRVVHAAWSRAAQAALRPWLDDDALSEDGLRRAARPGDPLRAAREVLLNGVEAALPAGHGFRDADGHERFEVRLQWWRAGEPDLTWRSAALAPEAVRDRLPDAPLPPGALPRADDASEPVVFGHYWMRPPLAPLSPRHLCVDASVAKGGRLAAYRFSGESRIEAARIVYA